MSGGRLRRRLDRVGKTVVPAIDCHDLEAMAQWAGVSPAELLVEARRIATLCREEGAQTTEARLAAVAADSAMSTDALRTKLDGCFQAVRTGFNSSRAAGRAI